MTDKIDKIVKRMQELEAELELEFERRRGQLRARTGWRHVPGGRAWLLFELELWAV